jgi:mono/diheme cytochrome c family protein
MAMVVCGGLAVGAQEPDPKLVAEGKKAYSKHDCSKCHRIGRVGAKKGPLDGVAAKLSAADIRKWLTVPAEMEAKLKEPPEGTNSMANTLNKKPLTPAEVDALAAYMLTLTKK